MMRTDSYLLVSVVACSLIVGCVDDSASEHGDHGDDHSRIVQLQEGSQQTFRTDESFRQVGLMVDAPTDRFQYRVAGGEWRDLEITWSEDVHHVGRVILDEPVSEIEIRADQPWTHANVQFYDEVVAGEMLARDLPVAEPEPLSVQSLAPADLVISRAAWGARNPSKVCGSAHNPYRMAIHHTASPDNDGGDAAARMRQMQAYHIDSNGWCDIGYHFVVSQGGNIYQGRSDEQRTGAHVGNQNSGNIGVSLIGNFQVQTVGTPQFNATAEIVGWAARTYDIPFNRQSIKGHREHAGQSTSCPGNDMINRLDDLIAAAENGPTVEPGTYDGAFQVNWLGEQADFYQAGSSSGKPDVFVGDTLRAEIVVTNTTPGPIRNVALGYWFEAPHLRATNYTIETDAPGFDGTFMTNDADENPDNPPKASMGDSGALGMYAFASGETKRVVIDLEATEYSIGLADHPDVRGWVQHIDDLYGEQPAFNEEPTNANAFDALLQGYAELDVLSTHEWQFDAGEPEQHEGWSGCAGVTPVVDPERGTLHAEVEALDCLESPAWTSIDADTWDQLVLRMDVPDGAGLAAIYWGRDGESFSEDRALTFEVDGSESTYVVGVGEHPDWSSEVVKLRIVPSLDASGSVDVDAVFFQSTSGEIGSAREPLADGPAVTIVSDDAPEPADPDSTGGTSSPDLDDDGGDAEIVATYDRDDVRVKEGCSTATGGASGLWLFLIAIAFRRRRRV